MGLWHYEHMRPGHQVCLVRPLHRFARVDQGRREIAVAGLCRIGYRAGETDATGGTGNAHAHLRIGVVDNDGSVIERARATGPHLVAEQSSSTVGQFAQTMLVRCDSRQERQVRRWLLSCFLSNAAQR
jgi:hypothetical protein